MYAQIQRTLLRSAGVTVRQWRSEAVFYAGNALSTTLPGGPVLSATSSTASTVMGRFLGGRLVATGHVRCPAGGRPGCAQASAATMLGAKDNPFSLLFTLGGFIALLLLAQAVATHPELITAHGIRVLG